MKKKKSAITLIVLLVIVGGLQLIPVERSNPPVIATIDAPPGVMEVLKRSCFDCHSNETRWPWYAQVAPSSFFVAHHVEEGREHLNFSTWSSYSTSEQAHKLKEALEEIEEGEMPMSSYLWLHNDARLTESDRKLLADWITHRYGASATPDSLKFHDFAEGQ